MRRMRCLAELTIQPTGTGLREELWPGLEVDFDRELAPGLTVAQAIAGREDCFEPAAAEEPGPPVAKESR
jgi:hypothetical protein